MAVVQLRFDQKGKYSYSTIANINQSHKQQLIAHELPSPPITTNGESYNANNKRERNQCTHNGIHKKDLITQKNVKSRSNGASVNNCRHTSKHYANHNGHSINHKVCLCELEFRDKISRQRSESIKVDNWEYIYKEKSPIHHLNAPTNEHHNNLSK